MNVISYLRQKAWWYFDLIIIAFVSVTALGGLLKFGPLVLVTVGYCSALWCYPGLPTSLLILCGFMFIMALKRPGSALFITFFAVSVWELSNNLFYFEYTGWLQGISVWLVMLAGSVIILHLQKVKLRPTWLLFIFLLMNGLPTLVESIINFPAQIPLLPPALNYPNITGEIGSELLALYIIYHMLRWKVG